LGESALRAIKNTQSEAVRQEPDTPTIDSQNEDAPELSLRRFLVRPKKTSSELIESSTTTQPDKSSTSSSPTTQSRTVPNSTRKNSTCSTVTEKNSEKKSSIDSEAVRVQNIEEIESVSRTSIGGIEAIPINEIWNASSTAQTDSDNDNLLDEMEKTSEYNSDSESYDSDDLPNPNIDRQRIWRKYKYLNRADCPKSECLYASEKVQPEGWIIRQEYPHCYRYFHNLYEFERWHESIPEYQRTFHEVIRIGQPQKIKIDMDGELEKFASYPDPLDRIKKAFGQKSFDGYIANTRLHTWQKSTDIMRKKDEISLYINNALRISIKEITGLNLSKNDIIIADSSNEMKWSKHLILP
ncbi:9081_t:CDS:2, partial [Paraglomus occultum]